ncbi:hypothetical protein B0T16DRAFT_392224 [Cercophora newfieldiana]|uniref:GRF-like zinc ribbon domain-containing protein n=1 Tax=Cercophora newfieldiana TaxID=92897 RepID=A0AA39Y0Y9_9PEZI|nr:hypothetical protein B0T16DRAFT_392224 [Cercophora newfieldiana]
MSSRKANGASAPQETPTLRRRVMFVKERARKGDDTEEEILRDTFPEFATKAVFYPATPPSQRRQTVSGTTPTGKRARPKAAQNTPIPTPQSPVFSPAASRLTRQSVTPSPTSSLLRYKARRPPRYFEDDAESDGGGDDSDERDDKKDEDRDEGEDKKHDEDDGFVSLRCKKLGKQPENASLPEGRLLEPDNRDRSAAAATPSAITTNIPQKRFVSFAPAATIAYRDGRPQTPVNAPASQATVEIDAEKAQYESRPSLDNPDDLPDIDSPPHQTRPSPPRRVHFSTTKPEPSPMPLAEIWDLPPDHEGNPPFPRFGPACLKCKKATTFARVQNKVWSAGRPYYACNKCRKFGTFADKVDIHPSNPRCKCGKACRKTWGTRRNGGLGTPFWVCPEGVCDQKSFVGAGLVMRW